MATSKEILQAYLNDTTIPVEKRSGVRTMITGGQESPDVLAERISIKYGNKYGSYQNPTVTALKGAAQGIKQAVVTKAADTVRGMAENNRKKEAFKQEVQKAFDAYNPNAIVKNTINAAGESAARAVGGVGNQLQGLNPFSGETFEQRNERLRSGLGDVVGGTLGVVGSPITGGVQTIQNLADTGDQGSQALMPVVEGVSKVASLPRDLAGEGYKQWARTVNPNLTEEELDKNAEDVKMAMDIVLTMQGMKGAKAKVKPVETTISKVDDVAPVVNQIDNVAPPGVTPGQVVSKVDDVTPKPVEVGRVTDEVLNNLSKDRTLTPFQKKALRSGFDEGTVNFLNNLDDEGRALFTEYTKVGINKLDDVTAPSVWKHASDEFNNFFKTAKAKQKEIGKLHGEAKEALKDVKVTAQEAIPVRDAIIREAEKLNIKVDWAKKKVETANSDLGKNLKIERMLKDLLTKTQKAGTKARDLESITSQIDNMSGVLKMSGVKEGILGNMLTGVKSAVNEVVATKSSDFAKLNREYAIMAENMKNINAAKAKIDVAGKPVYRTTNLLKKGLGDDPAKFDVAVQAMENISKEFGIPAVKDLRKKAYIANMAERVTKTGAPRAMQGTIEAAGAALAPGIIKQVVQTGKDIQNYLKPIEQIRVKSFELLDMLNEVKPKNGVYTLPKATFTALKNFMKETTKLSGKGISASAKTLIDPKFYGITPEATQPDRNK